MDPAPVAVAVGPAVEGRKIAEPLLGDEPSGIGLDLLARVEPHRHRQDPHPGLLRQHELGDGGGAVDALLVQRETVEQHVRQLDGADVGDVAVPGAAVDEDIVVLLLHRGAQGLEEELPALSLVEVVPVDAVDLFRVVLAQLSGREQIEQPTLRERRPIEVDHPVPQVGESPDVGLLTVAELLHP
nr:hypothetical protein GCM10020092_034230 [Actinoplanes digitatis]